MKLSQLLETVQPMAVDGSLDREITGITYDSRRVLPGHLFVAIRGERSDGHQFVNAAIDRGAAAVVLEHEAGSNPRVTRIRVQDSRLSLALASARFYEDPSRHLKVVGVTGTNGKTTTAYMIRSILDAAGLTSGLLGTVQYEIGARVIPAARTTPESVELQDMMSQMVRAGCRSVAMEVSSHALDRHRVEAVDFDVAVFTNLSSEHLDYHKTLDQYFEAKAKLFAMLGTKQKRGRAVVNTDDVYGRKLAGRLDGGNAVLTYGVSGEPAVCARDVRVAADGTRFVALTPRGPIPVAIPMIGRFNVSNALAAVATGLALGVDPASITQGLANMRRVPGRLERVAPDQAFNVFVDYAHTAEALRNVLATVGEITAGRVLAVFGCGGDRDKTKRQPMGWAGCELADFSILTSDNPRTEDPREILRQVATGFLPGSESRYMVIEDRREAIERALDIARPGDTVLIAGKGHETYQEFADTVVPFNDRQVIEDYLDQSRYITWLRAAGGRPGSPADKEQTRCA